MGFGLCLSLNWNIWEEKYSLKIGCCFVSLSGQLFAESCVFSGSLVVADGGCAARLAGARLPILKHEQWLGLS